MVSVPPTSPPSGYVPPTLPSLTLILSEASRQSIPALPDGAQVQTTITHVSAQGEITLATPYGEITGTLKPPYPLEKGTRLLVEVSGHNPRAEHKTGQTAENPQNPLSKNTVLLKIISVSKADMPPPTGIARMPTDILGALGSTSPGGSAPQGLPAQVLSLTQSAQPEEAAANRPHTHTPIAPGTHLIIRIVSAAPPPQQGVQQQTAQQKTVQGADIPTTHSPPRGIHPPTPASLTTSGPESPHTHGAPKPLATPLRLQGTMGANTYLGASVIHTSLGSCVLDRSLAIPPGHTVTLDITHLSPPLPIPPGPSSGAGHTLVTSTWPSVQTLLSALNNPEDADTLQMFLRSLPSLKNGLDVRIVAAAQAMMATRSHPTQRTWPGPTLQAALEHLKSGPQQALRDLIQEVRGTTRPAADGGPDWKMYHLPLHMDQTIEKITVITRRRPSKDDADKENTGKKNLTEGTRFLFHFTLSRLGSMQLDGLYYQKHRQLSLVIKSEIALAPRMRQDILALFHQSTQALGMTGDLVFRALPALSHPFEGIDPLPHHDTDFVV